MKLSIAWIFDHIQAHWKNIDIKALVAHFNQMTAEIEGTHLFHFDPAPYTLVEIKKIEQNRVVAFSYELKQEVVLPFRKDIKEGLYFLAKKDASQFAWATTQDFQNSKGGLLPAFYVDSQKMAAGEWKETIETSDVIIEIDNKSITHRPDMWGHRGFAREIAAILDLNLRPLDEFVVQRTVKRGEKTASLKDLTLTVDSLEDCKSITGTLIPTVDNVPSIVWVAHRLCRVDSKPISTLVDLTNYVMLDIGQPMHAFDADGVSNHKIFVRRALSTEKIMLLDGDEAQLTPEDLVVSDSKRVLGLAGVMGGAGSGVSEHTKSVILESGCFNPTLVRRTATRLKKRTEASARYEKTLDPQQTTIAIERYIKLLEEWNIAYSGATELASVGEVEQEKNIELNHSFIESRIGAKCEAGFVIHVLEKLGFGVITNLVEDEIQYTISVPTLRGTKDVTIKEDIVEEIARFYGFTNILPELPTRQLRPFSLSSVQRVRAIKQLMAYTGLMHEVQNYAIYDENFLHALKVVPESPVSIKNPVAEHLKYLVTSLIPHLIKNVHVNVEEYDEQRFFEWGRTWQAEGDTVRETRVLAGIIFDKKNTIDFYTAKNFLIHFFEFFGITCQWQRNDAPDVPWFAPHMTADLVVNGQKIGRAGKIHQLLLHRVCAGDAFAFEINGDFLLQFQASDKKFVPSLKYPAVERDISMRVPVALTAQELAERIQSIDKKIVKVVLIDFFEKDEWAGQRSMAFRFTIADSEKTLTKSEADEIWERVATSLRSVGAVIR